MENEMQYGLFDEYEPEKKELVVNDIENTALDLIRPGKFSIKKFMNDFEENTEKVLNQLLMLQTFPNEPLKKGGIQISYRADLLLLNQKQHFSTAENLVFDIVSAAVSSYPDNNAYIIYAKDIAKQLAYTDSSYIYKIFKEAEVSLSDKPLVFNIQNEEGKKQPVKIPWFSVLTYNDKDAEKAQGEGNYLAFVPTKFFKMLACSATITHGAYYPVSITSSLPSSFAQQLFYLFEARKNYKEYPSAMAGVFDMTLEGLQDYLGYSEKYRPTDVIHKVLEPAIKNINDVKDIDIQASFEPIKEKVAGKSRIVINRIRFTVKKTKIINGIASELTETDKAALDIIRAQGLSSYEVHRVFQKYKEMKRDLVFLNKALIAISLNENVNDKASLLVSILQSGNIYMPSKKVKKENQFNQMIHTEYDFDKIEQQILKSQNETNNP